MKKTDLFFYTLICMIFLTSVSGCGDSDEGNENVPQQLEANAHIVSFPLTIVTSNQLAGNDFPEDIKVLNGFSKDSCKTLPIGGILRLGNGIYQNYNSISQLEIPEAIKKNPGAINTLVDKEVNNYLSVTKLKDFASLTTPNQPDWNIRSLTVSYLNNTTDSVFFFSGDAAASSVLDAAYGKYMVYSNAAELRKKIDDIVCRGRGSISVFYISGSDESSLSKPARVSFPKINTNAGDTCIHFSRYAKLHDGKGGFMLGKFLEGNSVSCGFAAASKAGDTCVNGSKYEKLDNGKGGFIIGALLQANSDDCSINFPPKGTVAEGFLCANSSKYAKLHDGKGGFIQGKLIEANSKDCGAVVYTARGTVAPGFVCVKTSKYEKLNDGKGGFIQGKLIEANSKDCGAPTYPARGTPAGFVCVKTSKYEKLNDGKGDFMRGKLIEANSKDCGAVPFPARGSVASGSICFQNSKYEKLNDGKGGFTRGKLIEANSKDCGAPAYPARGTSAGFTCSGRTKYEKLNNGKGGFMRGRMLEEISEDCKIDLIDNNCFRKSEPTCEQVAGNFTGRRVQYCYNKLGRIVRVVVISKCDSDCRCF